MKSEARRVLLTGATRGLGRALVDRFVERGHTVLGCGRNPDLVEELRSRFAAPHDFQVVDVADDDAVRAWIQEISLTEAPDLVVNNAGVINQLRPLWQISAHEFREVMDVNVAGTANVVRHIVPRLMKNGQGIIVNFSSGWGRSASPQVAPYCASKWAIEGLTAALAQELPAGLSAVALNPGIIDTGMLQVAFGGSASSYESPSQWSHRAVELLLRLSPRENGNALSL